MKKLRRRKSLAVHQQRESKEGQPQQEGEQQAPYGQQQGPEDVYGFSGEERLEASLHAGVAALTNPLAARASLSRQNSIGIGGGVNEEGHAPFTQTLGMSTSPASPDSPDSTSPPLGAFPAL